ncbi:MAG TPA: flavodoxin domain-containing protein [Myxococcota bacterium]|nr:flavodoxin domain-containing protein [Myxococcota bacterium]
MSGPPSGAPRILIVFASRTGRTRRMAEALAEGAREAGATVELREAPDTTHDDLRACDALVVGSGVHMGGPAAPLRAFLGDTAPLWMKAELRGKLGAAFCSAGDGARGGAELALVSMLSTLAEQGMLLVPMHPRLAGFHDGGMHWGPVAHTQPPGGEPGPTAAQLVAAHSHGRWVAECAARWRRGAPEASRKAPEPG